MPWFFFFFYPEVVFVLFLFKALLLTVGKLRFSAFGSKGARVIPNLNINMCLKNIQIFNTADICVHI